jgi:hypothetical protein
MTHITTEIVHRPGCPEPLIRVIADDGRRALTWYPNVAVGNEGALA